MASANAQARSPNDCKRYPQSPHALSSRREHPPDRIFTRTSVRLREAPRGRVNRQTGSTTAAHHATATPALNKMSAFMFLVSLFCRCPVLPRCGRQGPDAFLSLDLRSCGGSGDSPNKRRPNDPRPAVMPTGLAVGLEPPRAPGAAGAVCPRDRASGETPWRNGRDWFPRCSGPHVRCTRLTVSFSTNLAGC